MHLTGLLQMPDCEEFIGETYCIGRDDFDDPTR